MSNASIDLNTSFEESSSVPTVILNEVGLDQSRNEYGLKQTTITGSGSSVKKHRDRPDIFAIESVVVDQLDLSNLSAAESLQRSREYRKDPHKNPLANLRPHAPIRKNAQKNDPQEDLDERNRGKIETDVGDYVSTLKRPQNANDVGSDHPSAISLIKGNPKNPKTHKDVKLMRDVQAYLYPGHSETIDVDIDHILSEYAYAHRPDVKVNAE